MTTQLSEIWSDVERAAREEGVLRVGACDLSAQNAPLFREWVEAGHAGSMAWLRKNVAIREAPHERYPWAHSAIVISVAYSSRRASEDPSTLASRISRYAQSDDYHDVLERILKRLEETIAAVTPDAKTRRYVDTGPLSDRDLAARAGLGWIAKNAMLIDQENGSYFFIGALLTSMVNDLDFDVVPDRCGTCTRCIEACPTDAILPNRTVHSPGCISYATIEHRGDLDPDIARKLEGNVFGCDICQEVCPWNREPAEGHPSLAPRSEYANLPVTALLQMDQSTFSQLFRKSAVKRAKLTGMIRNATHATSEGTL